MKGSVNVPQNNLDGI